MDINERVECYDPNERSTMYAYTSEGRPGDATIRIVIGKLSISVDYRFSGEDAFEEISKTLMKIARVMHDASENIFREIVERAETENKRLKGEVSALETVNNTLRNNSVSTGNTDSNEFVNDPVADGVENPIKDE